MKLFFDMPAEQYPIFCELLKDGLSGSVKLSEPGLNADVPVLLQFKEMTTNMLQIEQAPPPPPAKPEDPPLPVLSLEKPPKGGRLKGPAREQVEVLGAVPGALRQFVAAAGYDEEAGVEIELTSGIELRFGDSSQAARKWRAAAAVLADPSISALDYVDLSSPTHPATGGEGHVLPP